MILKLKKTIVLMMCLIISENMLAQQKDYNYYSQKIDSLKNVFSVERHIREKNDIAVFSKHFFQDNELPATDKLRIIEKVESLYKQKEYIGLYFLAKYILLDLFEYTDEQNIRQNIVYILVDKTFYTDYRCLCIGKINDYSDKTKQRLKELLEDKISDDEIDIRCRDDYANRKIYDAKNYKEMAQEIMRKTNRKGEEVYSILQDSLMTIDAKKYVAQRINTTVSSECIYGIIGYFDKSFVPYIESYMQKNCPKETKERYTTNYNMQRDCVFALAKLGERKYIDKALSDYSDFNWNTMRYLKTKEAFLRYMDLHFRWDKGVTLIIGSNFVIPSTLFECSQFSTFRRIPEELRLNIKDEADFERFIYDNPIEDFAKFNPQDYIQFQAIKQSLKIHEWLLNNTDKLEFLK
jgi:hypothetical protein